MQKRPRSCRLALVALASIMLLHQSNAAHSVDAQFSPQAASHLPSPDFLQHVFALQSPSAVDATSDAAAVSLPRSKDLQQQHDSTIRVWIPPFFALCASVHAPRPTTLPPHPPPSAAATKS